MFRLFKKREIKDRAGLLAVGCGGSGCNIVNRLGRMSDADILTVNTDSKGLMRSRSDKRILLGAGSSEGGCAGDAEKGRTLTKEAEETINECLGKYSDVYILTGLGGGTGTGSAEVIGNMAKRNGSRVTIIATIPMSFESERRRQALDSLNEMEKACDILLLLDGDMLIKIDPMLGAREAFSVLDQMICESLAVMAEMFSSREIFETMKGGIFTTSFAEGYNIGKVADALSTGTLMDSPAVSQPVIFITGNIPEGGQEKITEKVFKSTGAIPSFIQGKEGRGMRLQMFVPI
jgi:cell division GTPase FtsZ